MRKMCAIYRATWLFSIVKTTHDSTAKNTLNSADRAEEK